MAVKFSEKDEKRYRMLLAVVNLMVLLALYINSTASWKAFRETPLVEAATRHEAAAGSSFFFDSGLFEPVPVFALKAAMWLGVSPGSAVRAQGIALFCMTGFITLAMARRRYGELAGMMGAMFFAANPFMGYYAMQGDSHLFALLFMIFFWRIFNPADLTPRRAVIAGIWGGLACLSRADSAWFILLCVPFYALFYRAQFKPKLAALALGVSLAVFTPYLAYQKASFGGFLHGQELRLKQWSVRSEAARPAGGPETLSVTGFLFREGPARAAGYFSSGLVRVLSYELPRGVYYKIVIPFIFLGFYALFGAGRHDLAVFFLASLVPILPLASSGAAEAGLAQRFLLAPAWALFLAGGFGMQWSAELLQKKAVEYFGGKK